MHEEKDFVVYIMANRKRGVMYVGVTSNLVNRVRQHREGELKGFTWKYNLHRLVWFVGGGDALGAIGTEKRIKRWRREWKFRLIEEVNPDWDDLWPQLIGADLEGLLSHLQQR
jgi:putative endonuclease